MTKLTKQTAELRGSSSPAAALNTPSELPLAAHLDEIDRHLLALLATDARESAANLARRLGLARTTVLARITRMEKQGVIAGYGVRLGASTSAQAIGAFVGISVLPKVGEQVLKLLARMPEITELSSVSGEFDYMAQIACASTQRLDQVLDEIGMIEGVKQTHTSVVLAKRLSRSAL